LIFHLTHNLASGRIYFNNWELNSIYNYYDTSLISAKNSTIISVNTTFGTEVKQENAIIAVTESYSRSNSSSKNTTAILISNQNGPYLYQRITISPSSVYLTPSNFSMQSYVRNLMGSVDVNPNNTAYNVSLSWVLPTGFMNVSGNLASNYTNLSDNNLNYNNINISFSNLASITSGVKTFYINSYGYNSTGGLIKDVNNVSILNSSVNVTFLCYSVVDGIIVEDCGSLDGDYVAPVTEITTTTVVGGGGGGGGAGGGSEDNYFAKFVKSDQRFELVRGKDNEFILTFDNPYPATALKDLKVSLTGLLSEYISISPSTIDYLEGGKSIKINAEIKAPKYFSEGVYNLSLLMRGKTVVNGSESPFEVKKSIVLRIFELSRADAENMLKEISNYVSEMNKKAFITRGINNLFLEMNSSLDNYQFSRLKESYDAAKLIYENAITSDKEIKDMQNKLEEARLNGIKTPETSKIVLMSEAAFVRGDYATAIARLKEAKLSYALEVKGEFNLIAYVKRNPAQSGGIAVLSLFIIISSSVFIRYKLLKLKFKILSEEETLLIGLMKVVQKECFENGKMSMEEYENTMNQYEIRLNVVISDKIETETKLVNIMKIARGNEMALREEERRLKDLIKQTQQLYFEKGKLETRIYENMLKSYGKRLTEVEEKLATLEAERELGKRGFHLKLK